VITFLHITAGEQAPKWLAIQRPLPTSLWVVYPLHWFAQISRPFIWLLNSTSLWLLRKFGIESVNEAEMAHSEEELRLLLTTSQNQSGASVFSRDLVLNALELRRRITREVMRPRQKSPCSTRNGPSRSAWKWRRRPLFAFSSVTAVIWTKPWESSTSRTFAMRLKVRRGAELLPVTRKLIYVPESAKPRNYSSFSWTKLHGDRR
jgi:hypothetical protein